IAQCNALHAVLPAMFEEISDYTELLFPSNLLLKTGVLAEMVESIPEEDWLDQVQVIGWLYQYYISEKHKAIIDIKTAKAIKKEDVPAATQLFTTDWVVKYIIDNSLGKYWIERNPNSPLKAKLKYYVQPSDFKTVEKTVTPESITFYDPCMGSGHFLVYAFDVLMQIYLECGWNERDAAKSIVENNLYGIDIDERAYQLAYFAVMMKARSFSRRILTQNVQYNLCAIRETYKESSYDYLSLFGENRVIARRLVEEFFDAKEYGSILIIKTPLDQLKMLEKQVEAIEYSVYEDMVSATYQTEITEEFKPLLKQAIIMAQRYTIVDTNPPYLNKYDDYLKKYILENYADFKGDMFSVFMRHCFDLTVENGYMGYMTPNVWMFIQSYEKLRLYIIDNKSISSLIQIAKGAFFKEATVDVMTFVLSNSKEEKGAYIRLEGFKGDMEFQKTKALEALADSSCGYFFEVNQSNFKAIPGSPIAYWVSKSFLSVFDASVPLGEVGYSFQGIITGDNNYYLRFWHEISKNKLYTNVSNIDKSRYNNVWVPYNKGGGYRRWYGNNEHVLRWIDQGRKLTRARTENSDYYFREGVTWSFITSGTFSARYFTEGALWDVAGSSIFPSTTVSSKYICALLNSKFSQLFFDITNPTINYQVMNIISVPYLSNKSEACIDNIANFCIESSKQDWDSFETSWDFKKHPLI
ncbi:MAG: BREX-1 system adenine-specific DNA-methyltransferase PglX, partial [Clostridia bacterium]|nr:BREX-1 system adenine-specific DNA-methyltransferase PglX [Clostridia bacterium]